jgi:hypothetical protein
MYEAAYLCWRLTAAATESPAASAASVSAMSVTASMQAAPTAAAGDCVPCTYCRSLNGPAVMRLTCAPYHRGMSQGVVGTVTQTIRVQMQANNWCCSCISIDNAGRPAQAAYMPAQVQHER